MSQRKKKRQGGPKRAQPEAARAADASRPGFFARRGTLVVWVMMGLYSAVFITFCLIKYAYFLYNDFDLAIFSQAAHTTIRGSLYNSILGMNYLGSHMSLLMFLIAPIYGVFGHPVTLLVLQTVVLALGALPVYWLARRELKNASVAVCFAALYLLYPALGYGNLYEFHPVTLTTTTLLFAFYFMWVGRFRLMLLFAVLSLMAKENVPLVVMMMGFYSLLIRRRRRWLYAATLVGLAAIFLVMSLGVVMPAINKGEVQYQGFYSKWGDSLGEALLNMAKSPVKVLKTFFFTPGDPRDTTIKQQYYVHLLMPVLLLSLMSPLTLAIALPIVAQHVLSWRISEHSIAFHYTTLVTPFVLVAAVLGLRNMLRVVMRGIPGGLTEEVMNAKTPPRTLAYVMSGMAVVVALGCNLAFGPVIGFGLFQDQGPHEKKWPSAYERALAPYMRGMAARVPDEGPVASGFRFLSRFVGRNTVHSLHHFKTGKHTYSDKPYPVPDDVVAAAIDTLDWRWISFRRIDGGERVRAFFEKNRLEVVDAAGDVLLLLREPAESIKVFETGTFTPEHRYRVAFGGRVVLVGWDSVPASVEVGGKLQLRTVWERVGPEDRRAYPLYIMQLVLHDEYGHPAFDRRRQFCYTVYPVHDWPRGETVRETYNLVIPASVKPGTYILRLRVLESLRKQLRRASTTDPRLNATRGFIDLGKVRVVASAE